MKDFNASPDLIVQITEDHAAMTEAVIARDWDEVRFRCQLLAGHSAEAGFSAAGLAALALRKRLGVFGTEPARSYGHAMLKLAGELESLAMNRPV